MSTVLCQGLGTLVRDFAPLKNEHGTFVFLGFVGTAQANGPVPSVKTTFQAPSAFTTYVDLQKALGDALTHGITDEDFR